MTSNMWIALGAWLCLLLGVLRRRERRIHVPLMLTGIGADMLLVIYLQITRGAIQKALSFSLNPVRQLHIAASTTALLLYFPVLYLGQKLLRDRAGPVTRKYHVRIALTAFVFRTLGLILMLLS